MQRYKSSELTNSSNGLIQEVEIIGCVGSTPEVDIIECRGSLPETQIIG